MWPRNSSHHQTTRRQPQVATYLGHQRSAKIGQGHLGQVKMLPCQNRSQSLQRRQRALVQHLQRQLATLGLELSVIPKHHASSMYSWHVCYKKDTVPNFHQTVLSRCILFCLDVFIRIALLQARFDNVSLFFCRSDKTKSKTGMTYHICFFSIFE